MENTAVVATITVGPGQVPAIICAIIAIVLFVLIFVFRRQGDYDLGTPILSLLLLLCSIIFGLIAVLLW